MRMRDERLSEGELIIMAKTFLLKKVKLKEKSNSSNLCIKSVAHGTGGNVEGFV